LRYRKVPVVIAGVILVSVAVALAASDSWLAAVGDALVRSESPEKADAILVLAGDWRGQRILTACDLLEKGYAPVVLVSGPTELYGVNEADAAIRFAARHGCPENAMEALKMPALSTAEEARVLAPELKRRSIRNLLIVTSSYHTNRAGRIFEQALRDGVNVRTISAPDRYFHSWDWWKSREGQKAVFLEVSKTIAGWVGF
jgi:uncharacterized SAM-binding protein YcdF (DUF218 family)